MPEITCNVEYCGAWGYYGRFLQMEREITRVVPTADVNGDVGRGSSFEITVNGYLAWSKLATRNFPNFSELAAQIAAFAKDGKVPESWSKTA